MDLKEHMKILVAEQLKILKKDMVKNYQKNKYLYFVKQELKE